MGKYLEIKWHGTTGQGAVTAASLFARLMLNSGKHVQAFPQFVALKRRPSILAYNRISDWPIRSFSAVQTADVTVIMNPGLLGLPDVKEQTRHNTIFLVNTAHTPDFVKERLNLDDDNQIYTVDADTIVSQIVGSHIPNIPLVAALMKVLKVPIVDDLSTSVKDFLSQRIEPELAALNAQTVQRALDEVQQYEQS